MSFLGPILFFAFAALLGLFVGGFGSSIWWIVGSILVVVAAFAEAWLNGGFSILRAVLIVIGYNAGLVVGILFGPDLARTLERFRRPLRQGRLQDKSNSKK